MKFYLASSFSLIEKVDRISKVIEAKGHTITEKWWKRPYHVEGLGVVETADLKKKYESLTPDEFYAKPETKESFFKDYVGICSADVFVFVADDKPRKYNGASVELGIALTQNIECFVIGVLEKSVLFYPVKRCNTIKDVCDYLALRFKGAEGPV